QVHSPGAVDRSVPQRASATALCPYTTLFRSVCRELTKTYEEVRRGTLGELVDWAGGEVRGELSIVVAGAPAVAADPADHVEEVLRRTQQGQRLKDAAGEVAAATGVRKRELYEAALRRRDQT